MDQTLIYGDCTGEQHDEAVEAEGDAPVRRRPAVEGVEQVAELGPRLGLREADRLEDARLHVAPVDAQAAACGQRGQAASQAHVVNCGP